MDRTSKGLKIIIRNSDGTSSDITMYSDDGKMPSTIEIGGAMKTPDVRVSEIEVEENTPLIEEKNTEDPENSPPSKKIQSIGIFNTVLQILTALCALVTTVIMIMTLVKYFSTSQVAGAWPTDPKLYPTYLLLITSLATLVIDVFSLGERYCGNALKKSAENMISKMRYALLVFQAIGAATGAGVFKGTQAAGSAQDLYGWTCSDAADQMASINSSDLICNSSGISAIISILQTCLHVLGIIVTVVTMMAPKGDNTKDKGDEETGTKIDKKTKRASCASCGTPTPGSKSNKEHSAVNENSNDLLKSDGKPNEPEVDTEAIKSIVKQSQALYTRLQPSDDPLDISAGSQPLNSTQESHYAEQTGYADIDMNFRDGRYDDYDMQNFP